MISHTIQIYYDIDFKHMWKVCNKVETNAAHIIDVTLKMYLLSQAETISRTNQHRNNTVQQFGIDSLWTVNKVRRAG